MSEAIKSEIEKLERVLKFHETERDNQNQRIEILNLQIEALKKAIPAEEPQPAQ